MGLWCTIHVCTGHLFNMHAKFTLMGKLTNIHTIDKETLKF